jgi:glycosyltransferase involved in cell wall biosynthesis
MTTELPSYFGAYPPDSKLRRPLWLGLSATENALRTLKSRTYDMCFLQRNLTSTLCTWEPLLCKPLIFDVDDAIFLGPRGHHANQIAQFATLTICGNDFLANHFSQFGIVEILPTAVDANRFIPNSLVKKERPIIGWSGSSSGFKYLYAIEPALKKLTNLYPDLIIKVVADKAPFFKTLPPDKVVFEIWSAAREVEALQEFTVGIMPLDDDLWARGKCSFKMLTYMAVGLPVVVSPVGMNREVLERGVCGFAATTKDDWVGTIGTLIDNPSLANQMGCQGRHIVELYYDLKTVAPKLSKLLLDHA